MSTNETDDQRGRANDRDNTSGSGRVGTEVRSDSGRQAVSRGSNGKRRGGGLYLGVRGVDQVEPTTESSPFLLILQDIHEALIAINQTLKNR